MNRNIKRVMSFILVIILTMNCFTGMVVSGVAAETEFDGIKYIDENGDLKEYTGSITEITSGSGVINLGEIDNDEPAWYIVSGDVTRDGTINVFGNVHLILEDGSNLRVKGINECAGINVRRYDYNNRLTIYAQSKSGDNLGKITAIGIGSGAGIGGNVNQNSGQITINGGNITATGGSRGAGIGGGLGGDCGTVTINGGTVIATGNGNGAGIGGGNYGAGGDVHIGGGTVTASAANSTSSYAIGSGGYQSNGGTLTVDGGEDGATVIINTKARGTNANAPSFKSCTISGIGAGSYEGVYASDGKRSVRISDISGVVAPVKDTVPVTAITETEQYTGSVTWSPSVSGKFASDTEYTATITLTPKAGYTLMGVEKDFFDVDGADSVTNAADSNIVTAVFPKTEVVVETPLFISDEAEYKPAFKEGDDYKNTREEMIKVRAYITLPEPLDESLLNTIATGTWVNDFVKWEIVGKDAKKFNVSLSEYIYADLGNTTVGQGTSRAYRIDDLHYYQEVYLSVAQNLCDWVEWENQWGSGINWLPIQDEEGKLTPIGALDGTEEAKLIASFDTTAIELGLAEETAEMDIEVVSGDAPMTKLSLNGTFYDQGEYYQGNGPTFGHGETKDSVNNHRQRLLANKTPRYSNEKLIWLIEGTDLDPEVAAKAKEKYELYDARTGGSVVPFGVETDAADVYIGVKEGETINARDDADEVKITVTSAVNPTSLTDSCIIKLRGGMPTIYGWFQVYEDGELRSLTTDEMAFLYVVDSQHKTEPQYREIKKNGGDENATYELNLENSLAEHQIHASVDNMLLLNDDGTDIVPANTKTFTPGDYLEYLEDHNRNSLNSPFNFKFIKMPKISGRVVDQKGNGIPGVWITGATSCQTDAGGYFTTTLTAETYQTSGDSFTLSAYKEGYEYGSLTYPMDGISVETLINGDADVDGAVITLKEIGSDTQNPFSDSDKNVIRAYPAEVTSGQYSTLMAYVKSDRDITNARVTIESSMNSGIKDASGMIYVYELPTYKLVSISDFQREGEGKVSFGMPFIEGKEYTFSFGINVFTLEGRLRIGETSEVKITVNDGSKEYNVCNNILNVNDLTANCPTEITVDEALSVSGKVAASENAVVRMTVSDVVKLKELNDSEGAIVQTAEISLLKDQYLFSFDGIDWPSKQVGVYEVKVEVWKDGVSLGEVRYPLIVTPAPIEITSVSFYDNILPKITVPYPSPLLVFPQHVWMLDETKLDPQRTYKLDVGVSAATQELPDGAGVGGKIQNVRFIIKTRFGEHRYDAFETSVNSGIYSAEIDKLEGVGISEVYAEVTQSSFSDPRENITLKIKVMSLSQIVDPSGYVYDSVTGDRIEGATATLYHKDEDGNWVIWNADDYQQTNPQITDDEGKYGWMVPEGDYEVRVTKQGFDDYTTLEDDKYGVITVLPARTDINIGLTANSTTTPSTPPTSTPSTPPTSTPSTSPIPTSEPDPTANPVPLVHTITFDAGGGTGAMDSVTINHGDRYTIPANGFSRTGYDFIGWRDGTGNSYAADATINNVTDNIMLTAQWKIKSYTVTFKKNHTKAKGITKSVAGDYDTNVKLSKNGFTCAGFVFEGWNTQANGKGVKYANAATITRIKENITLYAQWKSAKLGKVKKFTVTMPKTKQLKVSFKKLKGAVGYRIQISTSSRFTTKTSTSYTTKKTNYTIKKLLSKNLKKGKNYYVRVQAYRKDSTGATVYGVASYGRKKTK